MAHYITVQLSVETMNAIDHALRVACFDAECRAAEARNCINPILPESMNACYAGKALRCEREAMELRQTVRETFDAFCNGVDSNGNNSFLDSLAVKKEAIA